ncbi:hypothetical protein ACVME8_004652 [Bradyrhizobium diazoefficiens]
MVCTNRDARQVGAALDRQNRDLRQRAGAAGEEGRGAIPAMDALEVIARAEGGAEGCKCKQADGEGIGADLLDQVARDDRTQRDAEQHQHGLGQDRRQGQLAAGDRGDTDRDHRARDQPAGEIGDEKHEAAGRADDECLHRAQYLGTARPFERQGGGDLLHATLSQIGEKRTIAASTHFSWNVSRDSRSG